MPPRRLAAGLAALLLAALLAGSADAQATMCDRAASYVGYSLRGGGHPTFTILLNIPPGSYELTDGDRCVQTAGYPTVLPPGGTLTASVTAGGYVHTSGAFDMTATGDAGTALVIATPGAAVDAVFANTTGSGPVGGTRAPVNTASTVIASFLGTPSGVGFKLCVVGEELFPAGSSAGTFAVNGLECDAGGTAVATACTAAGDRYTLSGCTQPAGACVRPADTTGYSYGLASETLAQVGFTVPGHSPAACIGAPATCTGTATAPTCTGAAAVCTAGTAGWAIVCARLRQRDAPLLSSCAPLRGCSV